MRASIGKRVRCPSTRIVSDSSEFMDTYPLTACHQERRARHPLVLELPVHVTLAAALSITVAVNVRTGTHPLVIVDPAWPSGAACACRRHRGR